MLSETQIPESSNCGRNIARDTHVVRSDIGLAVLGQAGLLYLRTVPSDRPFHISFSVRRRR